MIPKKIHYVWVGDREKPAPVLECIATWKKHLPEYEFIEWGNEQHEQIKNRYSEEAYTNKKWAFVSDYIRVYALYHTGGIYLDTDVKVNKTFNEFLSHQFFSSHEYYYGKISPITTAVMGAAPQHEIMKDMLDKYSVDLFEKPQGLNLQTNTSRFTKYFEQKYKISEPYSQNNTIKLNETSVIYPAHYFCKPQEGLINYSSHEFNASWQENYQRRIKYKLGKLSLVRFKKNVQSATRNLPIMENEKVIFKITTGKGKTLALIKTIKI